MKYSISLFLLLFSLTFINAQTDDEDDEFQGSVIQTLTPSKLIGKGQFDIKLFNNLYTQTESTFASDDGIRQTFFTATLEAYTGVGSNRRVNLGFIARGRSNVVGGRDTFDVFQFDGESGTARSGITAFAPSIKFVPFSGVNNFSIQSSLFIPLIDNETEQGVFLEQDGFVLQNRFFYDYNFPGNEWQIFAELTSEYNFGNDDDSFANDSLNLNPGIFLSYFPSSKFTVLVLAQHSQRIDLGNEFEQDFTALGGGAKYQLTDELNIEALYTNFVRGNNTGLGETFNLGFRLVL